MRLEDCIAAVLQLILSPGCSGDLDFDEAVRLVEQKLRNGSIAAPGRVPCLSGLLRGIEQANREAERRLAECIERCDAVRQLLGRLAELGAGSGEAGAAESPRSRRGCPGGPSRGSTASL